VKDLVAGARGRLVYENGDTNYGIWSVGMVQGLIHDIPSCAELVSRIVREAEEIIQSRLGRMLVREPPSQDSPVRRRSTCG
jgi:NADH:quinone reductase (non-electrogenic)